MQRLLCWKKSQGPLLSGFGQSRLGKKNPIINPCIEEISGLAGQDLLQG
jgi:hypothetical protein